MEKKIAVLITNRQQEGLRMALGLLLLDDIADLFVLDSILEDDPKTQSQLKTAIEMEMKLFTNLETNRDFELLTNAEIANRLPDYDTVIRY